MIIWESKKREVFNYFKSFEDNRQNEEFVLFMTDFIYYCVMDSSLVIGNTIAYSDYPTIYNIVNSFFSGNKDRRLQENDYVQLSNDIINQYFTTIQVNPLPPHPPAVQPTTGVTITFYGDPATFGYALYNTFTIATETTDNIVASNFISTSLINAIRNVFSTITGVYNGMMPTPGGMSPTPPIPWTGFN